MSVRSDPATWSDPRHRLGLEGEVAAKAHLLRFGWTIINHRFRMGRLEVDLVARKGRVVAFIEVKTRRGRMFGSPLEAITWGKRREICRVAQAWLDRHGKPGDVYRFDVIGVVLSPGGKLVQHVEDAFRMAR